MRHGLVGPRSCACCGSCRGSPPWSRSSLGESLLEALLVDPGDDELADGFGSCPGEERRPNEGSFNQHGPIRCLLV